MDQDIRANRLVRRPGVLVADDEADVRAMLEMGLQQEGFAVWLAGDGPEALEVCRRHRAEIDLALLEVRLPGLDGPQTLAALTRLKPGLRCCFMSTRIGPYTEHELLQLGAVAVLRKTFRPSRVAPILWRLLGYSPPGPQQRGGGLAVRFGWLWGRACPAPN